MSVALTVANNCNQRIAENNARTRFWMCLDGLAPFILLFYFLRSRDLAKGNVLLGTSLTCLGGSVRGEAFFFKLVSFCRDDMHGNRVRKTH